MKRVRCLLRKELAQLRRDPRLFGILIVAPLIQLLVLGFAANTDVREIDLAVRDQDHSRHSRELVRALGASGYLRPKFLTGPEADDVSWLVTGRAGLILVIPPGFNRRLERSESAPVQVLVDGADSNFAVQGLGYVQRAARRYSEGLVRATLAKAATGALPRLGAVTAESRVWYNPALTSRFYMVPAIMAQLLLVTTMIVTSMALVKEREEGTFEQLIVTPLRPIEVLAGKLGPFVIVGLVEMSVALPVMFAVFRVPFRGSFLLFYALSGLFLLTTLGLGLFISTVVRTQQQAMMAATFFVMMPFMLLSGFVFPIANMPPLVQPLAYAIPLTHYLIIVRGVFLRGAGWADLWPQAVILFGWGLGILTIAAARFRKRLD